MGKIPRSLPLKVEEIEGELGLRFHVQSRSEPEFCHLVDLSYKDGWCKCDCIGWQTQAWPLIRDGTGFMHTKATTCSHVRAALGYWLKNSLQAVIKHHGQSTED